MKTCAMVLSVLIAATSHLAAQASSLPQPELKLSIDLSEYASEDAYFRGSSAHFGDLNNDGDSRDFVRHVNSTRMQAFAFDGETVELLWTYESGLDLPHPSNRYFYKYVIWDLDSDGMSEVAGAFATASGTMEMRVIDGATGTIEAVAPLPIANPESDHRNRALRMKTIVADLAGDGTPSELVVVEERNSRGDIFVFDAGLDLLWSTDGDDSEMIYAHYPWAYDRDGDGRDELLTKYMHSAEGERTMRMTPEEWRAEDPYYDHLDKAIAGDFLPDHEGIEVAISYEHLHVAMLDGATLAPIWSSPGLHEDAKLIAVGEFAPHSEGFETLVHWPVNDDDVFAVILSATGEELLRHDREVTDGYTMDWDGDRRIDEVFSSKYGRLYDVVAGVRIQIRDNYYEDVVDRHHEDMRVYAHALDFVGDYREEIVFLDENELLVYGAAGAAPLNLRSPWEDPRYRLAVANQMSDNHTERQWFDWREIIR